MRIQALAVFATLIMGLTLTTSCEREPSDAVDQDKIFTEYELYYNANEDKTYARATFKFSNALGTKLELVDPDAILFDGDVLTWKPALAFYEKEIAGLQSNGTFTWTDNDGNTFTNSIEIISIAYPDNLDTIGRDAAYDLLLNGEPLSENQSFTLTANGENEGDAQVFFTDDIGATNIILEKNLLEQIGAGPGTLFLDRRNTPALSEQTSAGGILTGRYRPENAEVIFQ